MKKQIKLNEADLQEVEQLKKELLLHIDNYKNFKSFTKTAIDGVKVADSLINNDYETFKRFKLKYTKHTADKMRGLQSLSTYKKTSYICKYLTSCGGVCAKCYAERSLSLYETTLKPTLIYNTLLLKYIDIDLSQIDYINDKYFRFESFSDLQSAKHLKNLLTVCKKNKKTLFTIWSKAGYTLYKLMQTENIKKLPSNLNIVISEFYINKVGYTIDDLNGLQSVLNTNNNLKYFIVYNNDNMRLNSGFYQCQLKCIDCLKCYKKSKSIVTIAEKLR